MKKFAGAIRYLIYVLAGMFFLINGFSCLKRAQPLQQNVTLAGSGYLLSGSRTEEIKAAEGKRVDEVCFTVWREQRGIRISDANRLRNVGVNVLELYGSSEPIIPYGKILHEDDLTGCLLGVKTAEKLFGNRNAYGLTVRYGERLLTVRGILKSPEELLVVQNHDGEAGFDRITVAYTGTGRRQHGAEVLINRYAINVQPINVPSLELEKLLELIPGKWSDFMGWKQKLKQRAEEREEFSALQKSSMEQVCLGLWKRGWICVAAGGSSFLAVGIRFKRTGRGK